MEREKSLISSWHCSGIKYETLNVKPRRFSCANSTSHIDGSHWLSGWLVWILLMSSFLLNISHYLLSQFPRLWRNLTLMKGGKEVDIHFSLLKWFTLKIQTEINKYQQTMITDQLTSLFSLFKFSEVVDRRLGYLDGEQERLWELK